MSKPFLLEKDEEDSLSAMERKADEGRARVVLFEKSIEVEEAVLEEVEEEEEAASDRKESLPLPRAPFLEFAKSENNGLLLFSKMFRFAFSI